MKRPRPDASASSGVQRLPAVDDPLADRLFPRLPGRVQWGLGRTRRILAAVGRPLEGTPVLHVGGTNGKGSVAHIWASVLQGAGLRVGLYTSPNLISFRERILVDGRPLPDHVLASWADELTPFWIQEGASFFEAATTLACLAFRRSEVEVAVLEVGLGGRLDATNVVTPVISAITNIALEHVEMLGKDPAAIAVEKAGIMKAGVPTFTATRDPGALRVLAEEAATHGVPLHRVGEPLGASTLSGSQVMVRTRRWGALELDSPLVGRHQRWNVALAVRALEALPPRVPLTVRAVRDGVARARVPGRFQVETDDAGTWILDVAHNPAAARALAAALTETVPPGPRVGVVGILADKDHRAILDALTAPGPGALDALVLTTPDGAPAERRWDAASVRSGWDGPVPVHLAELEPRPEGGSVAAALHRARALAGPEGTVVVAGSFALVGEALRALDRLPAEALPASPDFG